jgi:acetoin utilization deacetylase AcuC-like enzyme/GNAT superfamily N-acetyltransferase
MFRIRQVPDDLLPANQVAVQQVQAILRAQFPGLEPYKVEEIPDQLRNPVKHRQRAVLLVAEGPQERVLGFAYLVHHPRLAFCFLRYLSAAPGTTSRGFGGALYERARELARTLGAAGLFLECLPDDPRLSPDPAIRAQNAARLRFYENYGAFPVSGTAYETPLKPGQANPPYLVYDSLGSGVPLARQRARRIVRTILWSEYPGKVTSAYVDKVTGSFRDDPVRLRAPRYLRRSSGVQVVPESRFLLVVTEGHGIHHVRERGYLEAPVRVEAILKEIQETGLFARIPRRRFPEKHLREVHDGRFLDYLKKTVAMLPEGQSVYPYVFPIRNRARPPLELPLRAGYYCIDTFTPINRRALEAAFAAADCALTAAAELLGGRGPAYALVRPPGHHAERESFGGFCYLNSAAAAAQLLSRYGRVALLDIDYHHGNGSQDIFFSRSDVLTISLHGNPRLTYPFFSGFPDERGTGQGLGFNANLPLPEGTGGEDYRTALRSALQRILRFVPRFLVLSLGLDTAKGDPTGSFTLRTRDFRWNGRLIGQLGLPTLVVQEGGYRTRSLGANARGFFEGLAEGVSQLRGNTRQPARPSAGLIRSGETS